MSLDWCDDVLTFKRKFAAYVGAYPSVPPDEVLVRRGLLVAEEFKEMMQAQIDNDLPAVADAIADLIYVLIGLGWSYGFDLRPIWNAIHEANMQKVPGDGPNAKIAKPPGWTHPDIAALLQQQMPIDVDYGRPAVHAQAA